ncbi:XrtA-associated tyrosine autokinase [Aquabacterium sp.]|jgi:protein-tyrosine kinase|uniref:XrtA-associated tyrosine autokinase n=1 Tax=Aquabacterium sp. TaxID=1872578 RepID=UPI0025C70845|nr:XrtA-associated tyrosine autokinase [Aquabacterium sp.]
MNTIEQAAKRLEQLRRAGVDVQSDLQTVPSALGTQATPTPNAADAPATPPPSPKQAHTPAPPDDRRSRDITVDLARMRRAGLLVPGQPRSQLEEEFRIVKRPLLENLRGQAGMRPDRANLIMVTSAMPSEGKTQTALNLAVSIAMELDHTVLLVEADVLRPSALERLGVTAAKGLLDLLDSSQTQLTDVLLRTNIPKLTLLPAGTASSRSTELLASDNMDKLLKELASKYSDRVVIFDTPPLLSTTESRVLASHMGQVVMVIEANKTPINTIKQAFATVESHPVVLSMLNKYRGPKGSNAYGYYAP